MLIGEGQDWRDGERQAWQELARLDPEDVCQRSQACFDRSAGHYILPLFNQEIFVSPRKRAVRGDSPIADQLLNDLPHYSILSALWYLIRAQDIPLSGNLINPREVGGGLIFTQGSHVLPLDSMVERYGGNVEQFFARGIALGGQRADYGDSSLRLFPFPRVPVVLLLWQGDDEFPGRGDVLFDATCALHLPTDIIWSTATLSVLMMLK